MQCTFLQFLIEQFDVGTIAGHPVNALRIEPLQFDELDALLDEQRHRVLLRLQELGEPVALDHALAVLLGLALQLLLEVLFLAQLGRLVFGASLLQLFFSLALEQLLAVIIFNLWHNTELIRARNKRKKCEYSGRRVVGSKKKGKFSTQVSVNATLVVARKTYNWRVIVTRR